MCVRIWRVWCSSRWKALGQRLHLYGRGASSPVLDVIGEGERMCFDSLRASGVDFMSDEREECRRLWVERERKDCVLQKAVRKSAKGGSVKGGGLKRRAFPYPRGVRLQSYLLNRHGRTGRPVLISIQLGRVRAYN